jgi:hypothetical protein
MKFPWLHKIISVVIIVFVAVTFPFQSFASAPAVNLANGVLTLTFGDTDDFVHLSYDSNTNYIYLNSDISQPFAQGTILLADGQPINMTTVNKLIVDLGGGNDNFYEPTLNISDMTIYGGPGNDVIKGPPGAQTTQIYGGPGDDNINAEHAGRDGINKIYGEDGNDSLSGSSDGQNYFDGGPGQNFITAWPDTWDPSQIQTVVYHQGETDWVLDMRAPVTYTFLPGTNQPGAITIQEPQNGGFDTLDFSAWPYTINLDQSSPALQVVSRDANANSTLNLTFSNPSQIEKIINPIVTNNNQRTISFSLEGRTNKSVSGTVDVLSGSVLVKSYPFTSDSSGNSNITFDIPTATYTLRIKASPYLSKTISVDLSNNTSYSFPQLLIGDINQDGIVNSIDYSTLNAKWFTADTLTDLNQDGLVNSLDYSLLNKNWFVTGQ